MVEVVLVRGRDLLALVAHQANLFPHFGSHRALVAALPQQTVYSLNLVPTLLRGNLGQVGGSLLAPSLVGELYSDAVLPDLLVHVVLPILEEAQDGD